MSSLMTNTTAMTALATLRSVANQMSTTQNRISTGYKVATASDNAAYWSIATTMRSDNAALSAVSDALGLGGATVDTMYTALTATVGTDTTGLTGLSAKLVAAREPGVDRTKIQSEITQIQADLQNTANLAVFNGENWLSVDSSSSTYNATKSIVSSYSRVNGTASVSTINIDLNGTKLYDATSVVGTTANVTSTGTFAAAAGSIAITVAGGPTATITTTATSTLASIAADIDKAGISNLSVAVTSTGQLTFLNRNTAAVTITAAGIGTTVGALAAATTASQKGILDKQVDYYDNTAAAWKTTTVGTLDISKLTDSSSDIALLDQYINAVNKSLGAVTQASAGLGASKTRIQSNSDFVKTLMDAVNRGIGQLVDADMNAESTRLSALQVQQQLGIQALSIANSSSQSILSLFK
jgi:flagellin